MLSSYWVGRCYQDTYPDVSCMYPEGYTYPDVSYLPMMYFKRILHALSSRYMHDTCMIAIGKLIGYVS